MMSSGQTLAEIDLRRFDGFPIGGRPPCCIFLNFEILRVRFKGAVFVHVPNIVAVSLSVAEIYQVIDFLDVLQCDILTVDRVKRINMRHLNRFHGNRRPTKLRTMFGRLLGWYIIYIYILGALAP